MTSPRRHKFSSGVLIGKYVPLIESSDDYRGLASVSTSTPLDGMVPLTSPKLEE